MKSYLVIILLAILHLGLAAYDWTPADHVI